MFIICAPSVDSEAEDSLSSVRFRASYAGVRVAEDLWGTHTERNRNALRNFLGCQNRNVLQYLIDGKCDVAIHSGWLSKRDRKRLEAAFGDRSVEVHEVGRYAVAVVVNERLSVRSLTTRQLGAIYSGQIKIWEGVGGPTLPIVPIGQGMDTNSGYVFRNHCLPHSIFSESMIEHKTKEDVIREVKGQPGAVGFFLHDWHDVTGVRLLKVANENDEPTDLTVSSVGHGAYPLIDCLIAVLHPDAPPRAEEFRRFAASKDAGPIAMKWFLCSEYERQRIFSKERLDAFRKGEGVPIKTVGPRAGLSVMRALAAEYVKASEVVRMPYVARTQELAVRDFCDEAADYEPGTIPYKPRAELILLDGKLGRPTDKYFGAWKIRANPGWHFDMGRIGVAIIAHKTNPVDWLSMDELREVYTNRIGEWSDLKRTDSGAGADSLKAGLQRNEIHRFGLKSGQPVFQVFVDKTLDGRRPISRFTQRDTTEEVIASVALDPAAIGFVSLTDLKPHENRVKILGIVPKEGDGFPETIGPHGPTEDYPLQQRWSLQLHAAMGGSMEPVVTKQTARAVASEETQRFVEFICTDERAKQVLREHGLIPASEITAEEAKKVGERGAPVSW